MNFKPNSHPVLLWLHQMDSNSNSSSSMILNQGQFCLHNVDKSCSKAYQKLT